MYESFWYIEREIVLLEVGSEFLLSVAHHSNVREAFLVQ
jgi:hypothetical protein